MTTLAPPPADSPMGRLAAFNGALRRRFVGMILAVLALSLVFHPYAAFFKTLRLFDVPGTSVHYDMPTLAMTMLMLSASINCKVADFRYVLETPRAAATSLVVHYVVGPALMILASTLAMSPFQGEEAAQIRIGLVFIAISPVALTSALWVKVNAGNVSLLLATVAVTTALALVSIPVTMGLLPGLSTGVKVPLGDMTKQLLLAVTLPLVVGIALRTKRPAFVGAYQPIFALLGTLGLYISVAGGVGAAAPKLAAQGASLLLVTAAVTVVITALGFVIGLVAARRMRLTQVEAIALTFSGGMRNGAAAMMVGAATFPTLPLVTLPGAFCIIAQQILAGYVTKTLESPNATLLGPATGVDEEALAEHLAAIYESHGQRDPGLSMLVFQVHTVDGAAASLTMQDIAAFRRVLRVSDFVCRLPPDRFAVVVRHVPAETLPDIARKVIAGARTDGRFDVAPYALRSSRDATSAAALLALATQGRAPPSAGA